jgi:hypothetical protein
MEANLNNFHSMDTKGSELGAEAIAANWESFINDLQQFSIGNLDTLPSILLRTSTLQDP